VLPLVAEGVGSKADDVVVIEEVEEPGFVRQPWLIEGLVKGVGPLLVEDIENPRAYQ
jgi:hypothetical protein